MLKHRQECKEQVDGVTSRFKKFETWEEAENFVNVRNPHDYKRKPFYANNAASQAQSSTSYSSGYGEVSTQGA